MNPPPGHGEIIIGDRRQQPRDVPFRVPSWAWPLLIAGLMGLGGAKVMLASKEDQASHSADMATVRNDIEKATIRDSAWKADAMRILIELKTRR